MNNVFIILAMIFCHIIDDYYLQGILANMKQKKWWQENAPQKIYQYDYMVALIMHSISWAFMIMLPIAISMAFNIPVLFVVLFVCNVIIHAFADNLKANLYKINLILDQSIHLVQIFVTALIMLNI